MWQFIERLFKTIGAPSYNEALVRCTQHGWAQLWEQIEAAAKEASYEFLRGVVISKIERGEGAGAAESNDGVDEEDVQGTLGSDVKNDTGLNYKVNRAWHCTFSVVGS